MSAGKHTPSSTGAHGKAQIEHAIEQVNRQIKLLRAIDPASAKDTRDAGVEDLQHKINTVLGDSFGVRSPEYRQFAAAAQDFLLDTTFGDHYSPEERKHKIKQGIDRAVVNLTAAKKVLAERLDGRAAAPAPAAEPPPSPPAPTPTPEPEPEPPAPAPAPTPAPTPSPSTATRPPMSKTDSASSSHAAQPAATGGRVAILGWGGDAIGQACEFVEKLGLEAAILDAVSVDQLEALRNVAFLLLLPGDDADAPSAMLAIGFMLAVLGRSRMACLLSGQEALPDVLKGATKITVDEAGLWQLMLAREMKRAGLDVDLNRAI